MRPVPVKNPPNPWNSTAVEYFGEPPSMRLQVFEDHTREILSENSSPDLHFRYSLNPYRGLHARLRLLLCAAYARVPELRQRDRLRSQDRREAATPPTLLREAFERPKWRGESSVFSGNTDCYQPLEASYGLTRQCLEVCAEYRNPVHIITKAPLDRARPRVLIRLHHEAEIGRHDQRPFLE